ncbi:MAG: UDP-glucose 4-epimerase GalE [Acidobacteriia bacterium]|nr:UDP-glucose 4-epimerase GalE [Terriglobia bacterium]
MNKILVTGGAGYIGSHTVKMLAERGFSVVVLDNLSEGHREALGDVELIRGDVGDNALLEDLFSRHSFSAVMYFAARCYVGESIEKPELYYRNNVLNFLIFMEALLRHGIRLMVFSSTAAVYGIPVQVPIVESQAKAPINPYGLTKAVDENMLEDFARAYHFRFVALRYFNAAGADSSGLIGESHHPETHLIPRVLAAANGQLQKVEVYGSDYSTSDGTCVRDYVHVNDLAEAHILALEYLTARGENLFANLGHGCGYSVRQIVDRARTITARPFEVKYSERRAGDPPSLVCDNSLARDRLHWSPRLSDLDSIIESAWNWELKRRY